MDITISMVVLAGNGSGHAACISEPGSCSVGTGFSRRRTRAYTFICALRYFFLSFLSASAWCLAS